MSSNDTTQLSPHPEAAPRPQEVTEHVSRFEHRATRIMGALADQVDGLQQRLDGAALALAGGADRQMAVILDGGFSAMPVADAMQGTPLAPQGEPVAAAVALAAAGEMASLPMTAAPGSVPAASSDVPLGRYTQAEQERQVAQLYDGMAL